MTEPLVLRDDVEDSFTGNEGAELPSQGGAAVPTILPAISLFRLPPNIDQCWEAKDYAKKGPDGQALTDANGAPIVEQHLLLKFDKDSPMILEQHGTDPNFNGLPATGTFTTMARKRGKKTDANAPMVADLTYLLRTALNDNTPIKFRKDWIPAINRHAGAVVRLEHGLTGQCDPERTIYIGDGAGGVIEDPNGQKGCNNAAGKPTVTENGSRLYTNDFKVKVYRVVPTGEQFYTRAEAVEAAGASSIGADQIKEATIFTDRVTCKGCGAMLRGFFRVERFLAPLASTQQQ